MAPQQTSMRTNARPRGKTPAERADEATAVQRRLKAEAAERRRAAAAAPQRPTGRRTP
jgi:hypothetical protein